MFYKKMKELALDCINLMPLSTEQEELLNYILNAGMYGDASNRVALNQVKKKGRFRVFFSRVFLPYNELSLYYPSLKKRKILLPFYQVVRWFNLCFGKNSRNFKRELKAHLSVSDEDKKRAERILNILDLQQDSFR